MENKSIQPEKLYFSFLHEKDTATTEVTYFNSKSFPWSSSIESNWESILYEVLDFLNKYENEVVPYFATDMVNEPGKWKAFSFYFWGLKMSTKAIDSCPNTIQLLQDIPNLVSASVSIMEPFSEIKPHYGDTDAMYRCHLGLVIPSGPDCGFRVGYEDRRWKEGELLIFNDAAYHKAWNNTNERRIILLFDVIKPQYKYQKKWICAKVRGNIVWQIISEKTSLFKSKKNLITKLTSILIAVVFYVFVFSLKRKSALLK